ncbi:hypothetical protein CL629_04260 [bacterium]|nr:hypothetical protein [bacterium]|tara:strand:- start:10633 stop:11424 length:792 start_codon:yes stop_codon:yes gene_type:complete
MKDSIKNYLGIALIVAVLAVGYATLSGANSISKSIDPSSLRSFTVSAEGDTVAVPDVAEFSFSVITEGGEDLGALQGENIEKTNQAITFLKKNGVDEKDIKTSQYSITPRRKYYNCSREVIAGGTVDECPPSEIVGYTITQSVSVKIRDFSKTGSIVAGVVENGANTTGGLSFTIDDPTSVQNEARKEAIEKAQDKAKAIARAAGFSLGRLISINEGGYYPAPRAYAMQVEAFGKGGAEDAVAAIEPGSEEITVSVTLTYEIK